MSEISKRVREQAAIICSTTADWMTRPVTFFGSPAKGRGEAKRIALAARHAVNLIKHHSDEPFPVDHACCWAEAEALLRTGWVPK